MAEKMRRDWIVPVLEDIRNFLHETQMPEFADEIDGLLDKYGEALRQERDPQAEVSDVIDFAQRRQRV